MSLKLKGIKTIANKLKQPKRDKERGKKMGDIGTASKASVFVLEPVLKPVEMPTTGTRSGTKVANRLSCAWKMLTFSCGDRQSWKHRLFRRRGFEENSDVLRQICLSAVA